MSVDGNALTASGLTKDYCLFGSQTEAFKTMITGKASVDIVRAINDISMTLPKGEIVGVIGHNGAGKSTLLRVLSGVYQPTQGRIGYFGTRSGLFELGGIGATSLTGRVFAERVLKIQGLSGVRLKQIVDDVKDFSELGDDFERKIITYSTGMGARLYFAVSTAVPYDIYLIDEALTTGDEHFQAKCWRRLRERLSGGASGILVTHDWSAVLQLCDYCFWFAKGEVKKHGVTIDIVREYIGQTEEKFTSGARFTVMPKDLSLSVGQPIHADFEVDKQIKDLYFGYSVERLQQGYGWQILALENNIRVTGINRRGNVHLKLGNPGFPPGQYYLNVFLTSQLTPSGGWKVYDARSWTNGKGTVLKIEGKTQPWMMVSGGQDVE